MCKLELGHSLGLLCTMPYQVCVVSDFCVGPALRLSGTCGLSLCPRALNCPSCQATVRKEMHIETTGRPHVISQDQDLLEECHPWWCLLVGALTHGPLADAPSGAGGAGGLGVRVCESAKVALSSAIAFMDSSSSCWALRWEAARGTRTVLGPSQCPATCMPLNGVPIERHQASGQGSKRDTTSPLAKDVTSCVLLACEEL